MVFCYDNPKTLSKDLVSLKQASLIDSKGYNRATFLHNPK